MTAGAIALIVLAVFLLIIAFTAVRIVPQARAGIVERLGRYQRTLGPGLALIVPFVDRVKPLIDLREQLTVTTLRNVIGGMTLEETLTSRDAVNSKLRVVLDEATGKWGIRVNRVELKSVEPPRTVQEAMEKQMRAERDRRAAILTAEGVKQSQILTAEGEKQAAVLKAEGARTAAILRAEGESKAIETVFTAIHENRPDERLLTYQYLQMLPQLAEGSANKVFVIPSEFSSAFAKLGDALAGETRAGAVGAGGGDNGRGEDEPGGPRFLPRPGAREREDRIADQAAADTEEAARAAAEAAREASAASTTSSSPLARSALPSGEAPPNGVPERE